MMMMMMMMIIIILIIIINSRIFGTTAIKNGLRQRIAKSGVRIKLKKKTKYTALFENWRPAI